MLSFFNRFPAFTPKLQDEAVSVVDRIVSDYDLENIYINVIFLTDDELLEMNNTYLGHDYYTDIITFNYSEAPKELEAELYISKDRVKENAIVNHVKALDELSRVIIHGVLHLAGYNDGSVEEKTQMRKQEDKYLEYLFHVKQNAEKLTA